MVYSNLTVAIASSHNNFRHLGSSLMVSSQFLLVLPILFFLSGIQFITSLALLSIRITCHIYILFVVSLLLQSCLYNSSFIWHFIMPWNLELLVTTYVCLQSCFVCHQISDPCSSVLITVASYRWIFTLFTIFMSTNLNCLYNRHI